MDGIDIPIGFSGIPDALNQLKKLSSQGTSAVDGIVAAFGALKAAAGAALAGATFNHIIESAIEGTQAIERMNVALKVSGDFTEAASEHFDKLASSIQHTANIQDEQIAALVSHSKAIGITNDQTEKLIKSSVDVAAVMGTDVNTAFSDLEKTLSGRVSRSLAQRFPELKQMSIEALASGEAVKVLGARFSGVAEELNNNFAGAAKGIGLAFGDILENIGKVIVQNPVVIELMQRLKGILIEVGETIGNNIGPAITLMNQSFSQAANFLLDFVDRNKVFLASILEIGQTIKDIVGPVFQNLLIPAFKEGVSVIIELSNIIRDLLGPVLQAVSQGLKVVGVGALQLVKSFNELRGNAEAVKSTDEAMQRLIASTFDNTAAVAKNVDLIGEQTKASKEYISALVETEKAESKLTNAKIKASQARQKAIDEEIAKQKLAIAEQQKSIVQSATQNPFSFFGPQGQNQLKKFSTSEGVQASDVTKAQGQAQVGQGLGILQKALTGPSGAATLISEAAGTLADSFLPGLGGIVAQIAGVLAQGPEAAKQFVQSFVDSIPTIIQNIIESIPAVLESLSSRLPILLDKLAELLPEVAIKFSIFLSQQAPVIALKFAIAFQAQVPSIIKSMAQGAFEGFKEAFSNLGGSLGGLFGGGGGGGGILGSVGSFLGFAEGGTVPGGAPFVDRIPAMLTPSETVIDRDLTRQLENFINSGGPSRTVQETTIVKIGEEEFARVTRNVKRKGYRVE